jgi:hypothetical protein
MLSEQETNSPIQSKSVDPDVLINEIRVQTLGELAHYHWQLVPDKGHDGFAAEFFRPMSADASINGEQFRGEFVKLGQSGTPVDLRFAAMTVACAYCVDVSRLLAQGERELAWWSMSEARYWCGVTLSSRGIEAARMTTITATISGTGRKSANAGVARRLSATKEEAFRLARECRPQEKGWKSRRQAMLAIKDRVVAFSGHEGRQQITKTGAEKTIYGWLAEMPDADVLFSRSDQADERAAIS